MLTLAPRCGVCGWRGEDDVCPRCGTVLLKGLAVCRRCGTTFEGPIARCSACGGTVEPPRVPESSGTIERLTHLPGVDTATAQKLAARGFKDPADLLKLALPERAVRLGVHNALARRLALGELAPAPQVRKAIVCPTCGAPREARRRECPACGARAEREVDGEEVRRSLEEVAGLVYDLAADPDFQGMPEELQEEILGAFEEAGLSEESEYAAQFREWKVRGFDTDGLEGILREEGPEAFRTKFVPIIRAQILKHREGRHFLCPLCDAELVPTVEECENCGAKFR